ncbi:hypothetical protein ABIB06_002682 [Bradyrhizobium sp. LB8.2]
MFSSRPGSTETCTGPIRRIAFDHVIHEYPGRRSAGRGADGPGIFQPLRIERAAVGNHITRDAGLSADFAEPVRAIGSAHHQDHIDQLAPVPYRRLAVLCRIADIPDVRALNICKAGLKCPGNVLGHRGFGFVLQAPHCTHYARAKTARLRQINFHWSSITQVAPIRILSPRSTRIPMSCNIRTIGFGNAAVAHAGTHGRRNTLCQKIGSKERGPMNFGSPAGSICGTIVKNVPVGKTATFCARPSVTFPPQLLGYTDRPA